MAQAFKYRLYPTEKQISLLNKHIGSVRFVYNLALETKKRSFDCAGVNLSRYDLQSQLKDLKKDCTWLKEVNSQSLQGALKNLEYAYLSFFKGLTSFPTFKKKCSKQSFSIPQYVSIKDNKLIIPKFKEGIDIVLHRPIKGVLKQATITKTATNKFFVSIWCDTEKVIPKKAAITEHTTIGIDLGIKSFFVTSDGLTIDNPRFLRQSLSKLKFIQSKFSKHKGKRTKHKLAKLHERIANQRRDFLHKISTLLIRENQSIAIEKLNVKGMTKNHKLAQSISDVSWYMFVEFLKYKSEWYGVNILQIGAFEPSSKTCSVCGNTNRALRLQDREWSCSGCGSVLDRDVNAAINIKNFALKKFVSGTETQTRSELPTLVGVLTCEA